MTGLAREQRTSRASAGICPSQDKAGTGRRCRMPGVCHRLEAALGQLFPRQIAQRRQAAAAEAADLAAATDRAVASGASDSCQASCDISGTCCVELCHGGGQRLLWSACTCQECASWGSANRVSLGSHKYRGFDESLAAVYLAKGSAAGSKHWFGCLHRQSIKYPVFQKY